MILGVFIAIIAFWARNEGFEKKFQEKSQKCQENL